MDEGIREIFEGLFHRDPDHHVLICKSHGRALVPERNTILDHIRQYHTRKKEITKNMTTFLQSMDPLSSPHDVPVPAPGGPCIPYLSVNRDARECTQCNQVFSGIKCVQKHVRIIHGITGSSESTGHWTRCSAQTFSGNRNAEYFRVEETPNHDPDARRVESCNAQSNDNIDGMIQRCLQKFNEEEKKRKEKLREIERRPLDTELTPWMRHTGWLTYFIGKDRMKIAKASHPPIRDERALCKVSRSIDRIFESCVGVVKTCQDRGWTLILRWIHTFVNTIPDKATFRIDYSNNTHDKYTREWKRLICYSLRAMDDPDVHGHKFRDEELELLGRIKRAAEDDDVDDDGLDDLVLQLSVLLIQHDDERRRSAIMHFTAVLGIKEDTGGFHSSATTYTSHLAGIIYCIRLIMLKHALPPETIEGRHPTRRVIGVHHQWLVDCEQSPFSDVSSLLAYGKGIRSAGGRPSVTWSKDSKVMWYRGRRIEVEQFRRFIGKIIDEAEKLLSEIICDQGGERIKSIDLRPLNEDMRDERLGLSFVDTELNRLDDGASRVLKRMKKLEEFGEMIDLDRNDLHFKPRVIKRIQVKVERFLQLLLVLSISPTGTINTVMSRKPGIQSL